MPWKFQINFIDIVLVHGVGFYALMVSLHVINRYIDEDTPAGGNTPDLRENKKNPGREIGKHVVDNFVESVTDQIVDAVTDELLDWDLDNDEDDKAVRRCARCSVTVNQEVGYYRCVAKLCTMGERFNLCQLCYSLGQEIMDQAVQQHYWHMKLKKISRDRQGWIQFGEMDPCFKPRKI